MPFGKGSTAMGFQICFKSVCFVTIIKCNRVFDTPRTEFCGMRHIAFVMFFKAGFQIFGTADIEMGSGCFINENVNIMKIGHGGDFNGIGVIGNAVPCCPASSLSSLVCTGGLPRRNLAIGKMKNDGETVHL